MSRWPSQIRLWQHATVFNDIIDANRSYASEFSLSGLEARARRGLAVVTCIDSRIEPLAMLGLAPGDAKIVRNAGGRVSDDALRSLILATNLLGVKRICVVQHTRCAMVGTTNAAIRSRMHDHGSDRAEAWDFLPIADQAETLRGDVDRLRTEPLLPPGVAVAGFIYDVETGLLDPVIG